MAILAVVLCTLYTSTEYPLLLLFPFNILFVHVEEFDVGIVPDRGVVVPVDMINNTNT